MSSGQLWTLLGAAVIVFWMVGAYNRLVRLRNDIGAAWAQIDKQLNRRAQALPVLLAALREPMTAEGPALDAVIAAQQQLQSSADALRSGPVRAEAATALAGASARLDATLARLRALLDQHPALREDTVVAESLRDLQDADTRLAFARQLFNDAGLVYDGAARQFPTRLLARLYRFGAAGRL